MFQVGRYDPQAEERKSRKDKGSNKRRDGAGGKEKKKKKRKRKSSNNEEELDHGHDVKNHRHSEKKLSQNKSSNVVENSNIPEIQEKKKDKNIPNNEDDEVSNVADNQKIPMKTKKVKVVNQNTISANKDDEGMESDSSSSVPSSSSDDDDSDDDDVGHSKKKSTEPAMHVIAPEQSPVTYLNRRNLGTRIDEEMDDFDDDDVLIEKFNKDGDNDETTASDASTTKVSEEISMALHMSSLPIKDAAATWGLASFLVDNLEKDGYDKFFPIQSLVIPDVIASERHAHIRARDVCVAAPTGSGKTLAFVLPVLNALAGRKVRRLRALVVLPSRDLAMQVYKVFDRYTEGSDLKVGLAIGQSDFKAEQEALTVDATHRGSLLSSRSRSMQTARQRYHFHRGNLQLALQAFPGVQNEEAPSNSNGDTTLRLPKGGKSAIDVLVATPGRLVDHLSKTPGFTLQHLRFLIIDEADRLVNQSYHNWIGRVVGAANEASVAAWNDLQRQQEEETSEGGAKRGVISPSVNLSSHGNSYDIDPITWRRGGAGGDDSEFNTNNAFSSVVATVCRPVQLRKLLYSATLTRDPQKLASLGLINAKHFDAHQLNSATHANEQGRQQRYSMPPGLSEYTVECTAEQKPLVLLALLLDQISKQTSSEEEEEEEEGKGIIVVFTSSLDSTHRLARLLQLLWGALGHGPTEAVAEFSSALNQKQRSSLMKQCNSPDSCVSVIVCSDGMSRGMDIPSVSAVINYDVPSFAKTYVHRCGRTARAGRKGSAISVLKGGQVTQFNRMRRLIEHPDRVVAGMGIRKDLVRHAVPAYRASVKVLGKVIQAEADNDLHTVEQIPATWIPRP